MFSLGSLRYSYVLRRESNRYWTLPLFLTYFVIIFHVLFDVETSFIADFVQIIVLLQLREAQARVEELETSNTHLQRRLDKLKSAKSALLKEL